MELSRLTLSTPAVPQGATELHVVFLPGRGALLRDSMKVKTANAPTRTSALAGRLTTLANVAVTV